jgi:hypothetical protein
MVEYLQAASQRLVRWYDGLSPRQRRVIAKSINPRADFGIALLIIYLWYSLNSVWLVQIVDHFCLRLACGGSAGMF